MRGNVGLNWGPLDDLPVTLVMMFRQLWITPDRPLEHPRQPRHRARVSLRSASRPHGFQIEGILTQAEKALTALYYTCTENNVKPYFETLRMLEQEYACHFELQEDIPLDIWVDVCHPDIQIKGNYGQVAQALMMLAEGNVPTVIPSCMEIRRRVHPPLSERPVDWKPAQEREDGSVYILNTDPGCIDNTFFVNLTDAWYAANDKANLELWVAMLLEVADKLKYPKKLRAEADVRWFDNTVQKLAEVNLANPQAEMPLKVRVLNTSLPAISDIGKFA